MATALFILGAATTANISIFADKIRFAGAPPLVQRAIRERAGHDITELNRDVRNGVPQFEAIWRDPSGAQQQLLVSEQGRILRNAIAIGPSLGMANQNLTLANKAPVALTEIPQKIQDAIQTRLLSAPVDSVERGIWNGQNIYEITYHDNGQIRLYQVTESGTPVVSEAPVISIQPRYNTAGANVPVATGAKVVFDQAPERVQRTVKAIAGGAEIQTFERSDLNGRATYEVSINQPGSGGMKLRVFEDGTVASTELSPAQTVISEPTNPPTSAVGASASSVTGTETSPPH